ncbi:phosphoribosylformylglycinamidine cyclo-ligase [Thermocrinis albus DSM 14484]|uniref:Phosphoribosylformylglycinamidine cyclo-ligase n=1 Tax=Thermocrinis albus (strain DSM 14484 / JCM 11386 / HI 11/12) TaxID=638303 RepID=D3SNZ7_THEAH|nr:phosphoribosylformylglycinamidine cyclo-ligase [Thermocrinis albus]ADC88884.1 phosphoribosylformylglycinamidine cyclo-ligase [Thermocrinis albus DSM 14484]
MGKLTYKQAGVDEEKAQRFVNFIKERVSSMPFEVKLLGSFASGVKIPPMKRPVVMMSTDGVGTKLLVAQKVGIHSTVGIDLVAMNVNDVITSGAIPIAFLDYIAFGDVTEEVLRSVMEGILEGCRRAEVPLVGGETAQMPDFYPLGVYDLVGFCVGICEEDELITGSSIREGDLLLAIPSSGFHSNGYSLIRKVLEVKKVDYHHYLQEWGKTVAEVLLEPTRIYWEDIKKLRTAKLMPKAMVHVTGGGIPGNLIRVLPEGIKARVDRSVIGERFPFSWIKKLGEIEEEEMFRVFNMGVGFILVVDKDHLDKVTETLPDAFIIGEVLRGERSVEIL